MHISVVIPAYNEKGNINGIFEEVTAVLASLDIVYEILFVDDASTDGTTEEISSLLKKDPHVRGIRLAKNAQKGGALKVGFAEAAHDIIVTLDADMQDDPKEIPRLLEALESADVIIGWKKTRRDPLSKRIPSKLMNSLANYLMKHSFHDMNSGFKALRTYTVSNLGMHGSMYRYLPHALAHRGYTVEEIPVHHRKRQSGRSKFGIRHRMRGVFDLMTLAFISKFSGRPLHFFGSIGSVIGSIGFCTALYLTVLWFLGTPIGNRPLLLLAVLLILLGVQIISIGLIGELIIRSNPQSQRLPLYRSLDPEN